MRLFWLQCKRRLLSVQVDNMEMLMKTRGVDNPKLKKLQKELKDLNDEIEEMIWRS